MAFIFLQREAVEELLSPCWFGWDRSCGRVYTLQVEADPLLGGSRTWTQNHQKRTWGQMTYVHSAQVEEEEVRVLKTDVLQRKEEGASLY